MRFNIDFNFKKKKQGMIEPYFIYYSQLFSKTLIY